MDYLTQSTNFLTGNFDDLRIVSSATNLDAREKQVILYELPLVGVVDWWKSDFFGCTPDPGGGWL